MIDMGIFHVLATWVIPCVDGMQADSLRSLRFMTDKTLAFLIANTASFWMNTQWVFESGRHRKSTEVALFVSVSLLSYGVGLQLGRFLIERFATNSHVAAITCIGAATVLNYIIRKSVVFRS
jgi:putative flippase GtrA